MMMKFLHTKYVFLAYQVFLSFHRFFVAPNGRRRAIAGCASCAGQDTSDLALPLHAAAGASARLVRARR